MLARSLGLSGRTVGHYLDLMADLLLVRRLASWRRNVGKRLVKAPRDPPARQRDRGTPTPAAVARIRPTTPSSGIAHQLRRGPFEQLDGLLPRNRGVVVQEVVESVTRLEVLHQMAIRLSKAFGSTPETLLGMQMAYDLRQARTRAAESAGERFATAWAEFVEESAGEVGRSWNGGGGSTGRPRRFVKLTLHNVNHAFHLSDNHCRFRRSRRGRASR